MNLRINLFFLLLINTLALHSQDWKKDLLAMNKTYIDAKSFQMDIGMKSFEGVNDVKPLIENKGKVVCSEGNYYTSMMGRITLLNKRCVLLIDGRQKIILYKKNKQKGPVRNGFSLANIDSAMVLMEKNSKVKYLSNNSREKRIEIKYKVGPIEKLEMAIDPTNNTLTQVVYFYRKQQSNEIQSVAKVEINYTAISLNKNNSKDDFFSEKKFIRYKGDKIVASDVYKKYEVINESAALIP